jgi:hypothetical protein
VKLGIHGLPLRSAVIARRRRRLRVLAACSTLCLVGFLAAVAREVWPQRAQVMADVSSAFTSPAPAEPTPVAALVPTRPVYRHSIVPGGAYSRAEVAGAMRKDAVVAAHYQDVDVEKVHAKKVDAARAVYVSYRVGQQVYWTKNRVQLSPGETVLTDGETEIRARCGNLVSDHAQQPVAAEEPPLAALDEEEPETDSSTIAGVRGPEGALAHVPFFTGPTGASSVAFEAFDPATGAPVDFSAPMWFNGGSGGGSPYIGSSTGTTGTSLVAPQGGSGRNNNNGSNGNPGGGNPGGSNPGGGNPGGGNPGGGNPGGGNPGGGNPGGDGPGGDDEKDPPPFIPPTTTTGDVYTTTGGTVTTTGNPVNDTTGGGDTTGGDETDGEIPAVPEPGTLVLLGVGACGLAARALRRRT